MAVGDHGKHNFTGHEDAELHALLDDPKFVAALQAYKIGDSSFEIPFLAGSNNDGTKTFVDHDFFEAIRQGKVKYEGKPYNPLPFISIHEKIEGCCIRLLGWDYSRAHDLATVAERRAVEHAGLDWVKYQDSLKPWIKADEAEKATGKTPPDLLEVPYQGSPQDREVEADEKDKPMANLTPDKRAGMPNSQFALPGKRFPLNDANHQRLAIGGATRAANAGNISQSTAERIKGEARAKLGIAKSPGGYVPNPIAANPVAAAGNPPMAHPRMHALTIAAATHLHNAGHLPAPQAARIKTVARANINRLKQAPQQPAPMAFGSLAPQAGPPNAQMPMAGPQRP